jgi:hypothetical protein
MQVIQQPHNQVVHGPNGSAALVWSPQFAPKWTRRYSRAQMFVDSEVLRQCEPFTPLLTGTMIRTGILGTDIGSGRVSWIAPYARRQYYFGRSPGTSKTGPLRGRYWFERMKEVLGAKIIKAGKAIAGGRK